MSTQAREITRFIEFIMNEFNMTYDDAESTFNLIRSEYDDMGEAYPILVNSQFGYMKYLHLIIHQDKMFIYRVGFNKP